MSATRVFALRSTLRAACRRPIQSQARITMSRRGYASVQGTAHQAAHKAGSDLPWLATSAVISVPTLAYLLFNGPEKKSHEEHTAEAADEHGVVKSKPEEEIGEGHEPVPTSHTDTGDAESKGHVIGYKPEDHKGGHEDSEEGAQPQDNVAKEKSEKGDEKDDAKSKDSEGKEDEKSDDDSGKEEGDKKQSDEQAASQKGSDANSGKGKTDSSGKDSKNKGGEMDDSTESQEKKLSEKPSSKRVDPTDK